MKKALILATLILGMAVVANAQIDLGISLGRDYIAYGYNVYFDRETPPFNVGGFINLHLGDAFKLGLRGGFSTLRVTYEREYDDPNDPEYDYSRYDTMRTSGFGVEARGLVDVPLNSELISLYGGLGLGYYSYTIKDVYHYEDVDTSYTEDSEGPKLNGLGQTFIAGCHLGISENFGINIELEGLGLSLMKSEYEDVDDYDYDDVDETRTSSGTYTPMTGFNDIGISVAAVLSF